MVDRVKEDIETWVLVRSSRGSPGHGQSMEIKTFYKYQAWSYLKITAWCVLLSKGQAWTLGWSKDQAWSLENVIISGLRTTGLINRSVQCWMNNPGRVIYYRNIERAFSYHNLIIVSFRTKGRIEDKHEVVKRERRKFDTKRYREEIAKT